MNWELSIGFYTGILLGARSYTNQGDGNATSHVLYLPFIDICLTIEPKEDE